MAGISLLFQQNDDTRSICHERRAAFPMRARPKNLANGAVVLAVVEHDDEDSINAIQRGLPHFPEEMTSSVGLDGVTRLPQQQDSEMGRRGERHNLWSVMRFRGLDGNGLKYAGGYDATDRDITRDSSSETVVGTWICNDTTTGGGTGGSPLVLLMFRPSTKHVRHIADRLEIYLRESPYMLHSLTTHPLFVYIVLYRCFNDFTTILYQFEHMYERVSLQQERNIHGIFGRTYQFNKGLVSMSYCQQEVLLHQAVLERLVALARKPGRGTPYGNPVLWEHFKDMEADLVDFKTKLGFITERYNAALALDFNLSGERLNLIMMWFTGFTVLFTPIAFVAAVFSIVDVDPIWFLVAGSFVLVISIGLLLWAYSSIVMLGQGLKRRHLHGLIHHLPYREKLSSSMTTGPESSSTEIPGRQVPHMSGPSMSSYPPRQQAMHQQRPHHHHHHHHTAGSDSGNSSASIVPAMAPIPHRRQPTKRGRMSQSSSLGALSFNRRPTPSHLTVQSNANIPPPGRHPGVPRRFPYPPVPPPFPYPPPPPPPPGYKPRNAPDPDYIASGGPNGEREERSPPRRGGHSPRGKGRETGGPVIIEPLDGPYMRPGSRESLHRRRYAVTDTDPRPDNPPLPPQPPRRSQDGNGEGPSEHN